MFDLGDLKEQSEKNKIVVDHAKILEYAQLSRDSNAASMDQLNAMVDRLKQERAWLISEIERLTEELSDARN